MYKGEIEGWPYPKVMNVWDHPAHKPVNRVVFMEKNGKFIAWADAKTIEEAEKEIAIRAWNFAADTEESIYLTAQEVSEGKGVGIKPELIRFKTENS